MKRLSFLMLAALCAGTVFGQLTQGKQKVAVYVTGDADAGVKKVIGAKLVDAITKDDKYAAVERTADFLAQIAKEQGYQGSGAVDEQQIVLLGKQFGARFVCVAEISNVMGSLFVSARMINVETDVVTATAERSGEVNNMQGLIELSDDVANGMLYNIADCNKKDQKVDKRGCCAGLVAINGICRDEKEYIQNTCNCEMDTVDIGPFSTIDDLNGITIPDGYRLPTSGEIQCLINAGVQLKFPQYADIEKKEHYDPYWCHGLDIKAKTWANAKSGASDFYQFYYVRNDDGSYAEGDDLLPAPCFIRLIKNSP